MKKLVTVRLFPGQVGRQSLKDALNKDSIYFATFTGRYEVLKRSSEISLGRAFSLRTSWRTAGHLSSVPDFTESSHQYWSRNQHRYS